MKLSKEDYKYLENNNIKTLIEYYVNNIIVMKKNSGYFRYKLQKILNTKHKEFYVTLLKLKFKLDFLLSGKISLGFVDQMITTKCSLQCEQCCSLMPFYNKNTHYEEGIKSFKTNLDNLLKAVNKIYRYQLIGGEPLLNKYLPEMVEYACTKRQIKIVNVVTNSTILPDEKLISSMSKYRHKCKVTISDYTTNKLLNNLKLVEIKNKFQEAGIIVEIAGYDWFKRGKIEKENRTINELIKVMANCWQHTCTSYCDGELHLCSRSIGIKRNIDSDIRDFVKIDGNSDNTNNVIKLFLKRYIDACDYCHTNMSVKIPRGIQVQDTKQLKVVSSREKKDF